MTTVHDITQYLEGIAPLHWQESYDNAGLLYGHRNTVVKGILISLDATPEVVEEAAQKGCNMIVSHHPIIFGGIKKLDPNYYVHQAVISAIKHDIALYAIHTNLDNVLQSGVNERFAQRLHLQDVTVLKPHPKTNAEDKDRIGLGAIGSLSEPMAPLEFLAYVKQQMQTPVIRHTPLLDQPISRVALCGGAGSFLCRAAIDQGADILITGDVKYHEFFESNGQIVLADIGHFESEQFTISLLFELLSDKFDNFVVKCVETNTNPVNYFYS